MTRRILLAGISTRALAESATRAGYEVVAVDGFGDLDLLHCATTVMRARDAAGRFSLRRAVRAARELGGDAVSYVASFENHPRAVEALRHGRALWGNSPAVLAQVRDPQRLARALERRGWAVPAVRSTRPPRLSPRATHVRWLAKPRASGGGHGITPWRRGADVGDGKATYFQQEIRGMPGSVVFAADGQCATAIGFSRLLVGERAFGSEGFRYCGNILAGADDPQFSWEAALFARGVALAAAITETFGLVGLNGLDFVARAGVPYPVEVNPRYTASMELVERAYGLSIFDVHARGCAGELPTFDLAAVRAAQHGAFGKAVVYARHDTVVGDTRPWLEDDSVRDVPSPGERIPRGRPVCTVFARRQTAAACHRALVARAGQVYRSLASCVRRSA